MDSRLRLRDACPRGRRYWTGITGVVDRYSRRRRVICDVRADDSYEIIADHAWMPVGLLFPAGVLIGFTAAVHPYKRKWGRGMAYTLAEFSDVEILWTPEQDRRLIRKLRKMGLEA